jgi:hypothetical protein
MLAWRSILGWRAGLSLIVREKPCDFLQTKDGNGRIKDPAQA